MTECADNERRWRVFRVRIREITDPQPRRSANG